MITAAGIEAGSISHLAETIATGTGEVTAAEAIALMSVMPGSPEAAAVLAGAGLIRQRRCGDRLQVCAIVNAKAGNCSEDCTYCAQSHRSESGPASSPWMEPDALGAAAARARAAGAHALGLVAAWRGIGSGPVLEHVCASVRDLAQTGGVRVDVSLGLIRDPVVARRLRESGAAVYHHNLETAPSFFPATCTTHTFADRLRTLDIARAAGLRLCCGGIVGLGESLAQRVELAFALRLVDPDTVPLNVLDPLPGTRLETRPRLNPDEFLLTLAMFRYVLPNQILLAAGGKEAVLGGRLHEILATGINAVMVGDYLTSPGTGLEYWRHQAARHGLRLDPVTSAGAMG